jgi:hypothetical protein
VDPASDTVHPGLAARVRVELGRTRRGVWLVAALAAVALVVTALLLAGGTAGSTSAADPSATPTTTPGNTGDRAIAGDPAKTVPPTSPPDLAALRASIGGDDPVAAADALLRLRGECLRTRSESCLEGVDQPGSVALAADLSVLRQTPPVGTGQDRTPSATQPSAPPPGPPVLVERLGGTAIVAVPAALLGDAGPETPPASLLMVRSEAGWRIRDVLERRG